MKMFGRIQLYLIFKLFKFALCLIVKYKYSTYQKGTTTPIAPQLIQEDEYYAFGLRRNRLNPNNRYLYNGKEEQTDLTSQYDYGARFYDPVIARWNVPDPLAEVSRRYSPYTYGNNNPIRFIDPDGMSSTDDWDDQNPEPKQYGTSFLNGTGSVSSSYVKSTGPTKNEALAMSVNSYDENGGNEGLIGGWKRSSAVSGITYNDPKTGLNSQLYERTSGGIVEYVYALGGTDPLSIKDLAADAIQLTGKSAQYEEAVSNAKAINAVLKNNSLTFVGHSLGGGMASASALATSRPAITFNAAALSNKTKFNLMLFDYNPNIVNYDVPNQIVKLQQILNIKPEGLQHKANTPASILPAFGIIGQY